MGAEGAERDGRGKVDRRTGDREFDAKRVEHEKSCARISAEVNGLHVKVGEITAEIRSLSMSDENRVLKDQLIGRMEQLKEEKGTIAQSRAPVVAEMKGYQEKIKTIQEGVSAAKEKLAVKSVEEAARKIQEMEARLDAGKVPVSEEARTMGEILKLKKTKKVLEELGAQYGGVEELKKQVERCRVVVQEKVKHGAECVAKIAMLGEEIGKLSSIRSVNQDRIRVLMGEREEIRGKIEGKNKARQELYGRFKEAQKEHEAWVERENEKKERVARRREIEERIQVLSGRLGELDSPPSQKRIGQCREMERYLRQNVLREGGEEEVSQVKERIAVPPGVNPEQVVRNKYVREEGEGYYCCLEPKSGKKSTRGGAEKPSGQVRLPIWVLASLEELRIRTPMRVGDVAETLRHLGKIREAMEKEQAESLKTVDAQRVEIRAQIEAETQRLLEIVV